MEFKVGDRVVATRTTEWFNKGDKGKIEAVSRGGFWVQFDPPCKQGEGRWYSLGEYLEPEETTTDIAAIDKCPKEGQFVAVWETCNGRIWAATFHWWEGDLERYDHHSNSWVKNAALPFVKPSSICFLVNQ